MSEHNLPNCAASINDPADRLAPVRPDDDADLPYDLSRGLFMGAAGKLAVVDRYGSRVDLVPLAAQYHPIRVQRVLATGATAGGLIALY